jgi:hypothetical protein
MEETIPIQQSVSLSSGDDLSRHARRTCQKVDSITADGDLVAARFKESYARRLCNSEGPFHLSTFLYARRKRGHSYGWISCKLSTWFFLWPAHNNFLTSLLDVNIESSRARELTCRRDRRTP